MFKSQYELQKYFEENPDPLGVQKNGGYKEYTMKEVALHNAPPSIWSVYKGAVYDITMYVNAHPGGIKMMEKVYGKDMTGLFNRFHGYINIDNVIGPLKIGYIKKDEPQKKQPGVFNNIPHNFTKPKIMKK